MAEILKKGYLLKCPQKAYAFKKWNSRWFVLYDNNIRGRVRLEYYDSEKSWQLEKGKRIIPLVTCVSIKPVWHKDYNHVIEIVTSDKTYFLAAGSKDEEKGWFRSLCKAVFGSANRNSIVHLMDRPDPMDLGYHSLDRSIESAADGKEDSSSYPNSPDVAQRNKSSLENLTSQIDASSTSTTDIRGNPQAPLRRAIASFGSEMSSLVSYESGFDDASSLASTIPDGTSNYQVTVRNTIASQNAKMSGSYVLQVTPLNLFLLDPTSHAVVADWPLQYLKRYGRGRTKFSFEAGDKCPAGNGVFTFNTTEGDAIFHQVDNYARKISAMQNPDSRDKRISLPDGFRPLHPSTKRFHHSEGRLVKDSNLLEDAFNSTGSFDNSAHDLLGLNSAHSTPNIGKPVFPSQSRTASGLFVIKDIEIDKSPKSQRQNRSLSVTENRLHERTESELSEEVVNNACLSTTEDSRDFAEAVEKLSQSCHSLLTNVDASSTPEPQSFAKTSQIVIPYSKRVDIPLDDDLQSDAQGINSSTPAGTVDAAPLQTEPLTPVGEDTTALNGDAPDRGEITIVKTVAVTTPPLESVQCNGLLSSRQTFFEADEIDRCSDERAYLSRSNNSLSASSLQPSMTRSRSASPVDTSTQERLSRNNSQIQKEEQKSKCERRLRKSKSKKGTARQQSFEHPPSEKPHINKPVSFSTYDYADYDYTYDDKEPKENGQGRRWPWKRTLSVLKRVEHYEHITKVAEQTTRTFSLWRQRSMRKSDK